MKHCEKQKVWQAVVREARDLSEQEPMLASFYHATIIKHDSLASALSYILANKLNTASMPAMAVREVIEEAFSADHSIIEAAACDICATVNRDPAVSMYSMPLLYLKGLPCTARVSRGELAMETRTSCSCDLFAESNFGGLSGGYSSSGAYRSGHHARSRNRHCDW